MENLRRYKMGMRTIKTGLSVILSLYIAHFLNLKSPVLVGLGAIVAMQSTVSESLESGKNRMVATIVGAIVALIFSYLFPQNYLFMGIGIIIVIHIHNLLDWKKSLVLSSMVFLIISLDTGPDKMINALNRVIDTFVGITISTMINYFIAMPNSEKTLMEAIEKLFYDSKTIMYNLVRGKGDISLVELKEEIKKIEESYELLKHDIELNIYNTKKSNRLNDFYNILEMLDDIYANIKTLTKTEGLHLIDKVNKKTFESLYRISILSKEEKALDELDIVYNYHLKPILENLVKIEEILFTS